MSLPIYQRVAVTDSGDVIPGAEYTVINENTGVAAPIYSDRTGATLLAAPYFADSVGTIQFFIAQGTTFRVAASGGVGTYTDRYIYAAHPQSSPTDTTANALMAVGAFGLGGDVDLRNTIYSTGTPDGLIGKGYAIGLGSGSALGVVVAGVGTLEVAGVYGGTGVHSGFTRRFTAQGRTFVQSGLSGAAWGDWNEVITANAAGNVGIGAVPEAWKSTWRALDVGVAASLYSQDGNIAGLASNVYFNGTNWIHKNTGAVAFYHQNEGSHIFYNAASGTAGDSFTPLERMRIDSAGNLSLGSTNAYSHRFFALATGASETVGLAVGANNTNVIRFYSSTLGTAGAVRVSAAGTSVSYNTSSDYRLKEDDVPMTGATERVKALRPINFAWKVDGSRVDGFFAHELAEVVPEAASGTKDAMIDEEYEVTPAVYEDVTTPAVEAVLDEDGVVITEAVEESTESVLVTEAVMATRSVPDYQGIDQSKLVPLLTATIQELIARIEALESGA